uniref:Uncharacterized protein n=1 Tax=Arundo donax TaxID=35708 RepID=A0A0A9CJ72_ARUDO
MSPSSLPSPAFNTAAGISAPPPHPHPPEGSATPVSSPCSSRGREVKASRRRSGIWPENRRVGDAGRPDLVWRRGGDEVASPPGTSSSPSQRSATPACAPSSSTACVDFGLGAAFGSRTYAMGPTPLTRTRASTTRPSEMLPHVVDRRPSALAGLVRCQSNAGRPVSCLLNISVVPPEYLKVNCP